MGDQDIDDIIKLIERAVKERGIKVDVELLDRLKERVKDEEDKRD